MDKLTAEICKQNPKISIPCGNSKCKRKNTLKSQDVFSGKISEFKCKYCGEVSKIVLDSKVPDQLEKSGITLR